MQLKNIFNIKLFAILLVFSTFVSDIVCKPAANVDFNALTRRRYCGKMLTNTLALLCEGTYAQYKQRGTYQRTLVPK